jgi:enamine deaminase RidA (YjgF/YER057c/UK114 family)
MPRTIPKKLAYVFDNSPYLNNAGVDKLRKQVASEVLAKRVKQTRRRTGCEPKVMQDVRNKRYHHACAPRRSVAEAEAILCAALRAIA